MADAGKRALLTLLVDVLGGVWTAACPACGLVTRHPIDPPVIRCRCGHTWGERLLATVAETRCS